MLYPGLYDLISYATNIVLFSKLRNTRNNPKYLDRQAFANGIDTDQTPQNTTSDHALDCFFGVCVEVLRPSQPNGVMSSAVSLPNHTFTGQA